MIRSPSNRLGPPQSTAKNDPGAENCNGHGAKDCSRREEDVPESPCKGENQADLSRVEYHIVRCMR